MINLTLHVNKAIKKQVNNCTNNLFGALTQPFILKKLQKECKCLSLLMFHEIRAKQLRKYFGMLNCVIYTIIDNYFCNDYLDYQSKKLSEISVDSKYVKENMTEYWVLGFEIFK